MNHDLETLARLAVACPRFRWIPGILVKYTGPANELHPAGLALECRVRRVNWIPSDDDLPDLSDPATLGCILALVREAFGDPSLFAECHPVGARWQIHSVDGGIFGEGDSEAAALVAALEAVK